jgi:hypothetical protein
MEGWPTSGAGPHEDAPVGRRLVVALHLFMTHLHHHGLSSRTRRRPLDTLWLIGSEIIRQLDHDPALRDQPPHALLLDAIQDGEAPLGRDLTEAQQAALDATARQLLTCVAASTPRARSSPTARWPSHDWFPPLSTH